MYVIRSYNCIEEERKYKLGEILDTEVKNKKYVNNNTRYHFTTFDISSAQIYKTKTGVQRFINVAKKLPSTKSSYSDKYSNIRRNILKVEKISKEEYNKHIDGKIKKLEADFKIKKEELESKRKEYK